MSEATRLKVLVVEAATLRCALPLASVRETMRPLGVEPISEAAEFVLGVSVIRGLPLPVVDLGKLVSGKRSASIGRYVTLAVDSRQVALAVDSVVGVRELSVESFSELPQLLSAARSGLVEALATLDSRLLLLLDSARTLPSDASAAAAQQAEAP
ncbi:MAG: CheW domain-containing protein [Polyangiaceae bacterium]